MVLNTLDERATFYQGMAVLLYLRKAPWSFSVSPLMVCSMVEQHVSVSMSALGPPISVSTHPGCMLITRMPSSLSSMLRFFMVWIEDVESFSPDLHEAMYSHLFGHRGNFLPEDARMGVDMRTSQYVVSADSEHRVASMAAMIQPLCLVASCEFCQMQNYIQL